MRKKAIALISILCIFLAMSLSGCSSNPYSNYDLSEYIKIGQYKGLEIEKIQVSVSDEEVQAKIKSNVEETATKEKVKEGTVAKDDAANIDYEGKIDGKAFEGGTAKGQELTIGSGQFIKGFEEGLIGKPIGSTQTLKLKFPDDYQSQDVAGKDVVFTVKINYVSKSVTPAYNLEWIKENSKAKTEAEYEQMVKDQLLEQKEAEAKNNQISQLFDQVMKDTEVIKYPEKEVEEYMAQIEAQYESVAKQYGVELEQIWQSEGFQTEKEFKANNKKTAQEAVKYQMVIYYIADKEGLEYTKEEEKELRDNIDKAGYTEDTFKENTGMDIDTYVESSLTSEKVGNFIYDNAKQVDKPTKEKDKDKKETPKATQKEDEGADDATSNDEAGGADA